MYYEEDKCKNCDRPLVAIKDRRANGASGQDWPTRKFHRKCWGLIGPDGRLRERKIWEHEKKMIREQEIRHENEKREKLFFKYMDEDFFVNKEDFMEECT
jgi:hypothetical protein